MLADSGVVLFEGYRPPAPVSHRLSLLCSQSLPFGGLDFTLCTQVWSKHLAWPIERHVTNHLMNWQPVPGLWPWEGYVRAAENRVGQCGGCCRGQGVLPVVLAM